MYARDVPKSFPEEVKEPASVLEEGKCPPEWIKGKPLNAVNYSCIIVEDNRA
jgi:hypothetical protein